MTSKKHCYLEPICEDATVEVFHKEKQNILSPNSPTLNFKFFPKSTSLFRLKCTTSKLGLDNRRPSIEAWKQHIKKSSWNILLKEEDNELNLPSNERISDERVDKINSSLEWLRSELLEMKKQDQALASQFLKIKKAIYNLKLEWSCQDHQYMIEEAKSEMDELEELRRVSDIPLQTDLDLPLKEKGCTKLNVCSRRYSLA